MEDKGIFTKFTDWLGFNMPPAKELGEVGETIVWMVPGIAAVFAIFLFSSAIFYVIHRFVVAKRDQARGYQSLKTVTFGDSSVVVAVGFASIMAVLTIFFLWALASGSKLLGPVGLPAPFVGQSEFTYTAQNAAGETADATVFLNVATFEDRESKALEITNSATGFAKDDSILITERRQKLLKPGNNDDGGRDGYKFIAINGTPIEPNQTIKFADGEILMTGKGSLAIRPYVGPTMEALYLPPPEQVWEQFVELNNQGYEGVGLWEHVFWSLSRVVIGFFLGCLFGIPLGFAMGLNGWLRGWFDPVVEFMRPVPPLALIPLIIIWFGIGEQGKIVLLFLAALWIMTIAARSGVSGVNLSKIHAAYSLGATKKQVLNKVLLPNSLPEIFTGARVAMGVCWGTVVAAELVAAEKGIGKMIIAASKFGRTDVVIVGIVIIGIIGFGIEVMMRKMEDRLIPWKGKG